ncbi:MAG: hypothetical protein D6696_17385 [Acidobacteria bacterium]|nr:MAG: hypothetical protein D6696_17385 [Acidobacteriota bacterium]
MRPVAFKHRLEFVAYRLARRAVLALPHGWVRRIGRGVGRLYGRVDRRRRRLVEENLARAMPQLTAAARRRTARDCFAHFGQNLFDSLSAIRFAPAEIEQQFAVEGWEHVEEARAGGKGFFLLTAHYGPWELAAYPLGLRLGAIHFVARPQSNPLMAEELRRLRERLGNVLIPKRRAGHRMLNVVRQGGCVALAIDQRVRPQDGILLPFFGLPAWTSPVLAFLSIHTGAAVVPAYCETLAEGRYRLAFEAPIWPQGRGEEAEAALTRRYLASIEQRIRRRPEQWLWMHRRWQLTAPARSRDRIDELRRASGLPAGPELVELEGVLPPAVYRDLAGLAATGVLERPELVLLHGPASATSRAAAAVGHALIAAGHAVRFAPARELAGELAAAAEGGGLARLRRQLDLADLLIVDRLETVSGGAEGERLAELVAGRRGRRSTLVVAPCERTWRAIAGAGETWDRSLELPADPAPGGGSQGG